MKVLFVLSNSETAFWLSELTHPYWHLTERGVEVDLSQPERRQGRVGSLQRSLLQKLYRA